MSTTRINADLPYDDQAEGAVRRGKLQVRSVQADRRRPLVRLQGNPRLHFRRHFLHGDTRIGDKTKSNGFWPRVIASWEPNRNLSVNIQAAKGFRLGGINDPLNLPICTPADRGHLRAVRVGRTTRTRRCGTMKRGVKYSRHGDHLQRGGLPQRNQELAGHGRCRQLLVAPRLQRAQGATPGIEAEFSAHPLPASTCRSPAATSRSSSIRPSTIRVLANATGIRDGNRLPTVPKFQIAATATYEHTFSKRRLVRQGSVQHIGSRFTQPSDQEPGNPRTFVHGLPFNRQPATQTTVLGSETAGLQSGQPVGRPEIRFSGLELVAYVNNLFDKDPKLSFDRERGGRARLRLQRRSAADDRADGSAELRRGPCRRRRRHRRRPRRLRRRRRPAPDGSVILRDGGLPAPPPPPPPPPPPAPEAANAADRTWVVQCNAPLAPHRGGRRCRFTRRSKDVQRTA